HHPVPLVSLFKHPAPTEIYTLSLHDALPISMTTLVHLQAGHPYPIRIEYFHSWWEATARLLWLPPNLTQDAVNAARWLPTRSGRDRKSTRLNSSHVSISYAVFCLKKKKEYDLARNQDDVNAYAAVNERRIVVCEKTDRQAAEELDDEPRMSTDQQPRRTIATTAYS